MCIPFLNKKNSVLLLSFLCVAFFPLITAQIPQLPIDALSQLGLKDLPNITDIRNLLFPWLKFNSTNSTACSNFVDDLLLHPRNYIQPLLASGKKLNDYGDPFACRRQSGFTYLLFMIKLRKGTDRALIGFCSPSICTTKDYQQQEASLKPMIANASNLQEDQFDIVFADPQAEEDKVQPDTYTHLALIIMGTIIVLGALGSYYDSKEIPPKSSAYRQSPQRSTAVSTIEFSKLPTASSKSTQINLDTSTDFEADNFLSSKSDEKTSTEGVRAPETMPPAKPRFNFINFCKCFSFYTNGKKLLTISKITDEHASTECLNGFRVLTMLWVILGHTYYYHLRAPILNLDEWLVFIQRLRNQVFVAIPLAVDSFLFLGGFLGAYLMLKEIRGRQGKLSFIQVWIHRIYRIVPLYLLLVLFGWKILPQFIIGVGGYNYKDIVDSDCNDTWWSNIIFLNNFLPVGKTSACFGYSWYLAVDMQCFLLLPILVIIYYKNRRAGWIVALTLSFGSILLWFVAAYANNWAPDLPWILEHMEEYFKFYVKPYYRFAPYGLGVITGLLLSEYKDESLGEHAFARTLYKLWKNCILRYLTYLIGIAIIIWSIFIHHPVNNGEAQNWSRLTKSAFLASQRSIWVFGWILLLMPTMMGWGRLLRAVLGAGFWSPLTRLTFGAYLIHPQLQVWYYWNLEQAWFIGNINSIVNAFGFATASYILAVCFSLMAEAPAMNIEKFWAPQKKR